MLSALAWLGLYFCVWFCFRVIRNRARHFHRLEIAKANSELAAVVPGTLALIEGACDGRNTDGAAAALVGDGGAAVFDGGRALALVVDRASSARPLEVGVKVSYEEAGKWETAPVRKVRCVRADRQVQVMHLSTHSRWLSAKNVHVLEGPDVRYKVRLMHPASRAACLRSAVSGSKWAEDPLDSAERTVSRGDFMLCTTALDRCGVRGICT